VTHACISMREINVREGVKVGVCAENCKFKVSPKRVRGRRTRELREDEQLGNISAEEGEAPFPPYTHIACTMLQDK
jgi:hypothetical protein